jgi:hypothetical protein
MKNFGLWSLRIFIFDDVFDVNDETNHNSRLMLELCLDGTYNTQHTPMNIDEMMIIQQRYDRYRRILMRRGTYNIQNNNLNSFTNVLCIHNNNSRLMLELLLPVFVSSKNLEPIKLNTFTNVSW